MPTIRIPAGFDCMPGAAHFVDKELTDEVTVAAKELVPATRMSIYEKMQLQFMERAPCAMLLQQTEVAGLRKGVSGMRIGVIPDYTIYGDITKH
jgi:peptide/nickel transport system substrate-binding protein